MKQAVDIHKFQGFWSIFKTKLSFSRGLKTVQIPAFFIEYEDLHEPCVAKELHI